MIDRDHAEQDARIARNMEWTLAFLQSVLADPSILDEIPDEASVFLLPDDDPELAEANRRGAERARQRGRPVYVRRMPSRQAATNGRPAEMDDERSDDVAAQRRSVPSRVNE